MLIVITVSIFHLNFFNFSYMMFFKYIFVIDSLWELRKPPTRGLGNASKMWLAKHLYMARKPFLVFV